MRTFFGLTGEYIENVYEQFFFLKHYGSWSFTEAYNLPIGLRKWFVERLMEHMKSEQEAMQQNSPSNTKTLSSENQPSPPPGFGIK
tara:strand:- start:308 stop:565 length:258 start_codon:yes stop_codon:yes gene_type:complete